MQTLRILTTLYLLACSAACSSGPHPIGGGGAAGAGGSPGDAGSKVACMSSTQCAATQYCTTEDGVCNTPPGCTRERPCPAVCYGTCEPRAAVYDCDLSGVVCEMMEPECQPGYTVSAKGSCYGPCVRVDLCKCSPDVPTACPDGYFCWADRGHCWPF